MLEMEAFKMTDFFLSKWVPELRVSKSDVSIPVDAKHMVHSLNSNFSIVCKAIKQRKPEW